MIKSPSAVQMSKSIKQTQSVDKTHGRRNRGAGGGGNCHPPPQYFANQKNKSLK